MRPSPQDPTAEAAQGHDAPTWDMAVVFPSLGSPEFESAYQEVVDDATRLRALWEKHDVCKSTPHRAADAGALDEVIRAWNSSAARFRLVDAYVGAFVTTDTTDTVAQAKDSALDLIRAERTKLATSMTAWVGTRDGTALGASAEARDHSYWVERCVTSARHTLSSPEEDLAADLAQSGSSAWARLHSDVTSQMRVEVEGNALPMAVVRNLAYDPDQSVRIKAYAAELAAWETVKVPCAAAMNGIKGEAGTLASKRGWAEPLDIAVFESNIDRAALEAMMEAASDAFSIFRRYLKAKAGLVGGATRLSWADLYAPVGEVSGAWGFTEGAAFVAEQFETFSPKLGAFARRAVAERWIDAKPGDNKVGGAFCMGLRGGESRLLQTWKPSFGAVGTLAHELGHAYHNLCLQDRTELQRETPMTMAETASIFCETVVISAALKQANPAAALGIVEHSLQRSCAVVVDISSRFLFEKEVFARRRERTLSAGELCEVMAWAQEQTYGDGLGDERHPYMWAVKPHYYSLSGFYNFPYMFGQLFSLGLFAEYQTDPDRFRSGYDQLLGSTGLADAADLAARYGIDIRTKEFWSASLRTVEAEVVEFERLIALA